MLVGRFALSDSVSLPVLSVTTLPVPAGKGSTMSAVSGAGADAVAG